MNLDTTVAAVLVAAGVDNAHDVARGLYEEEFDVETLRISSFDDVEEFGIVDEATMQRIHECLPPELPPPMPTQEEQERSGAAAEPPDDDVPPPAAAAAVPAPSSETPKCPKPSKELCCPITLLLFTDPVMCVGDGETYERSAIERHIADRQKILRDAQQELDETGGESERAQRVVENGITSPMGHGTLESLALVPARALRRLAEEWRAEHGDGEE